MGLRPLYLFSFYNGRLKYSAHMPKVGNILCRIFPHTDEIESFVYYELGLETPQS
jgi:hypothetical protein